MSSKSKRPMEPDSDKATLDEAYPVGYLLLAHENPSLLGIPGRWIQTNKVWIRAESSDLEDHDRQEAEE